MRCAISSACVSGDGHDGLCVRLDGTVIMARRTPEATAQIAAAREPPDAMEIAMTSGIDDALEERYRGHVDRLRHVLSVNATPAGKLDAVLEEARSGRVPTEVARRVLNEIPSAPTPRVLTTNHPEIADPGERARLGLDPVDAFGHVYRDPIEERMREVHAATPDPGPVFAVDESRPKEPSVVLTGNDLDTFESFSRCAAALEQHAEQGQALQVAYRNALQAVSAMAARRNRGR